MSKFFAGPVALVIAMLPAVAIAQRLILTRRAPNRSNRPARILVQESQVSLAIRAGLLRRDQKRRARMQTASPLRILPRFPESLEAKAVRQSDRHRAGNNRRAVPMLTTIG